MKLKPEHVERLRRLVYDSPIYGRLGDYRMEGLSDKHYRWDCLWRAHKAERTALIDEIYQYANDTHIDAALRSITGTK